MDFYSTLVVIFKTAGEVCPKSSALVFTARAAYCPSNKTTGRKYIDRQIVVRSILTTIDKH